MDIKIEVNPKRYENYSVGVFPNENSIQKNGDDIIVGINISRNFEDEDRLLFDDVKS